MKKFRILSLDGGGIRGLLTACLIKHIIEARPKFLSGIDAIAGTSTGGIIALGLASGMSINSIINLYRKKADRIFEDSFWDDLWDMGGLTGAEYSQDGLEKLLKQKLKDKTLGDLSKLVLIPTFKLYNEKHDSDPSISPRWYAKYYHNFPEEGNKDLSVPVVRVALRTSAAPTYFPTCDGHIDGGVVFNNPTLPAIAQVLDERCALSKEYSSKDILVLSLGTGTNPEYIEVKEYGRQKDWGVSQWVKPLTSLLVDANMESSDFITKKLLPDKHVVRIAPILQIKVPMDSIDRDELEYLMNKANQTWLDHQEEILDWIDGDFSI